MPARRAVFDGVDAAVNAVQLPSLDTVSNRPCPQASAFELPPRDKSMLTLRDSRHLKIGRVAFLTHVGT
jgi:hypothetical protein